jgi:hypothetical protein
MPRKDSPKTLNQDHDLLENENKVFLWPAGELLQPATFPVFVFDLSSLSDRAMIQSSSVFFPD